MLSRTLPPRANLCIASNDAATAGMSGSMDTIAASLDNQVQTMVDSDASLALAAAGADDKSARVERSLGESQPFARSFSRIRMTNEERSVAA